MQNSVYIFTQSYIYNARLFRHTQLLHLSFSPVFLKTI